MTLKFTVFSREDGRILFSGEASDPMQFESDADGVLVGYAFPPPGWIDGEAYCPVPEQPSPAHIFNYTTKQWEDTRTLDGLKAAKNAAINAARLRANQSHFTFAGKQIAADPLSRSDIDGAHGIILALQAMPPGWPGGWKAMDNTICVISDVPTWMAFYGAMVAQGTANFAHAQALKAQLAAATTAEEVAAVPDW